MDWEREEWAIPFNRIHPHGRAIITSDWSKFMEFLTGEIL